MTWPHRDGAENVGAMKHCNGCGLDKPLSDFRRRWKSRDGYLNRCRVCSKAYEDAHREKIRSQRESRREMIRESNRANRILRFERDPVGQERRERNERLKSQFHITLAEYEYMFEQQEGKCGICDKPSVGRRLAVDHDHRCCPGKKSCGLCIRGLLCGSCNAKLGFFELFEMRVLTWRSRRAVRSAEDSC